MAEKVKVSREVADAIDFGIGKYKGDKTQFFNRVCGNMCVWNHEDDCNIPIDLTPFELAVALQNGYEIEETPEEQFIKWYKDFCPAIPGDAICLEVIHKTIEILGIKIKGFNE